MYYSVEGAERLREELPSFRGGRGVAHGLIDSVQVSARAARGNLLLHDYLKRGFRDATQPHVVSPQPEPIPVSAEASVAVERTMPAKGINDLT